jgi:hypothetical protein
LKHASIFLVLLVCSLVATAQKRSVSGVVTNGTTQKPSAGDEVILIKLGQGMEEEARTKADARGEFKFTLADNAGMHLIRVRHDNVNYHEIVAPNANRVHVTVYNAVAQAPGLKLTDESEVYEATASELQVVELFRINNSSSPGVTQPTFELYLPEGAQVRIAEAASQNENMPVNVTVVPQKDKNRYTVMHPLRPGVTQFQLAYTMPYTGKVTVHPKLLMPADHFYVVTVPGMQFASASGAAFETTSPWPVNPGITGVDVHAAANVTPAQNLSFEISGTGTLPRQQDAANQPQGQSQSQAQAQEDNRPGGGLGTPNEKPDPLHSSQWLFLAVLTLFLIAGAAYVYTAKTPGGAAAEKRPAGSDLTMQAMKEEIFQLEAERLQGRISAPDYDAAKAALDKTLQRAVQREKEREKAAVRNG